MTDQAITLIAGSALLAELKDELAGDVEFSKQRPESSPADGLDTSISPDDIVAAAQAAVAIFSAGNAAIVFARKLLAAIKRHNTPVVVSDVNGRRKRTIRPTMTVSEVQQQLLFSDDSSSTA